MKLSSALLQTITLSVSITALAVTTSCEKEKFERTKVDQVEETERDTNTDPCPACGMG